MKIKERELNKNWRVLKFRECINQLNTGLNPRRNFSLGSGNIKYITAKNLTKFGTIDFSKCDYIDEKAKKIINKRSDIRINDILFSSRAPIGHCHLIKEEPNSYDIGESIFSIRPNKEIILPEYLSLYLTSEHFIKSASKQTTGSIILEIRVKDLMNTDVIVPPKEIQRNIAKCINDIDAKLEGNNKINDNLQQVIDAIYSQWFESFNFPNTNGKPYKQFGGEMINVPQFKYEIPANFKVVSFLDVCFWETNSQPPKSEFIYEQKDGYVRFIQNRDYDSDSYKTYIPITKSLSIVDELDILMDKYGDAGKVRYGINGAFNVALAKIGVHKSNAKEYIRSYLSSKAIYTFLHNSCMASTRASLNEDNLKPLFVTIPPDYLLDQFENKAHKIRCKILENDKENRQLKAIRDELLPLLMNGQITITD